MTQTGGLVVLAAWAIFLALLGLLGFWVLRGVSDPDSDARRHDAQRGRRRP